MKLYELCNAMEQWAPLSTQEPYDNSGLILGSPETEDRKALICLDITQAVLTEAIDSGCDVIISHHPMIFRGLKKITPEHLIYQAIQAQLSIYAAHTNLDKAPQGVSEGLAQRLDLHDIRVLAPEGGPQSVVGLGAIGRLEKPLDGTAFLRVLQTKIQNPCLRHSCQPTDTILWVAVCGGAGADMAAAAQNAGAHVLVTADARYHDFDRQNQVLPIVDIGHYESECQAIESIYSFVCKNFPTFAAKKSEVNTNFVQYFL